jgi:phage I-like protein
MNGYVKNTSPIWMHAMKRSIGPGKEVALDELYEQYGIKHDLQPGEEFIQWLRNVKLKDKDIWKIIINDEKDKEAKIESELSEAKKAKPAQKNYDNVAPMTQTKMQVSDVVELSVRNAREVLPNVTDLNLLKYALKEANQLSGKDSLCRIIRKRIRDLQIAR